MYRRHFLKRSLAFSAGPLCTQVGLPAWARSGLSNDLYSNTILTGNDFDLFISQEEQEIAGRMATQVVINKQMPAPLLRWKEGEVVNVRVNNQLVVDSSLHWHGLLLPFQMDGVPGVSFPGISPDTSYQYTFELKQAGTYWYHSHSGLQEQQGLFGPIIIDPIEQDPFAYDREYILVLSDWSYEDPHHIYSTLKKMSDNYNFQRRTVADFFSDAREQGLAVAIEDRAMWGAMRMNPTDLSDVTGAAYTYLINGHGALENWTALFRPGERIRLRFINASAMTIFNVRIPGLPVTVVQADGLSVMPVETDEFQIGTAETFDVIVNPTDKSAYTIYCETNDRSGYARATLAVEDGMKADIPGMRARPLLTMKDMGMSMDGMDMGGSEALAKMSIPHVNGSMSQASMVAMGHDSPLVKSHLHSQGPGVSNIAMNSSNRLGEKPLGLESEHHRVLVYAELLSLDENPDLRQPQREIELHLTSNMERYMWSFDGVKFSEVIHAIDFTYGERVRLNMTNDTMMPHPIHLHGMYFDVVAQSSPVKQSANATSHKTEEKHKLRKHTIVIKPGERLSVDITADALGEWALHCHLLYHMHAGMMQTVLVKKGEEV